MAAHEVRSDVRTCSSPARPKVMAPKMMGREVVDMVGVGEVVGC